MDGHALLKSINQLNQDQNIPREVIFASIEAAIQLAAQKHFGEKGPAEDVVVTIDRDTGTIQAKKGDQSIDPGLLGRIAAQSAKQLMIQKFREAACEAVFNVYAARKGDLVKGTIQRFEHGTATVTLADGKSEAILPRSEQIPGETHHVNDRVDAVILDVKKNGHRVKIILSRTHPEFVRQLFEKEIPEIADRTIEIKAIAREAGYRTKVAVSSIDMKVDCVGACVGVRGSRIKNIVDALGGERIDIVRWNDALQVLIPNALQPANIEEVYLYTRLGRAIVLVQEDQLSLAIGRRGQNVRLASKLVGWDIEIMTVDELTQSIERAEGWFSDLPNMTPEIIEALIEEGFLSFGDLTCIETSELAELTGLTEEQAQDIVDEADVRDEELGEEPRAPRGGGGEGERAARQSPAARAAALMGEGPVPTPAASGSSEAKEKFESLFAPSPAAAPLPLPSPPGGEG
ncbi:MAG: transcription termination factor NusA, partial [Planctomycetes bacterium]|nr:transcription termination factor NusA [Planctomycetota bacterium]